MVDENIRGVDAEFQGFLRKILNGKSAKLPLMMRLETYRHE